MDICEGGCILRTLRGVTSILNDHEKLVKMLVDHKVIKREYECEKCGSKIEMNDKWEFKCRKRYEVSKGEKKKKVKMQCDFYKSARVDTWFGGSHLSVPDIIYFTALWCFVPHPRHALLEHELQVSSKTVVDWSNFCREVCIGWVHDNSEKLGGEGKIVEIDEAKFGRRKYNRGRVIEGHWVFGAIERESKKVFLRPVPSRDKETLLEIIKEWVLPGTTIISDFWKAYDCLNDEGYRHAKVNHSLNFVNPEDRSIFTQNIERIWRDARGGVPKYGRRDDHFVGYLAEFLFKRQHGLETRLHEFLLQAANLYPSADPKD